METNCKIITVKNGEITQIEINGKIYSLNYKNENTETQKQNNKKRNYSERISRKEKRKCEGYDKSYGVYIRKEWVEKINNCLQRTIPRTSIQIAEQTGIDHRDILATLHYLRRKELVRLKHRGNLGAWYFKW